MLAPRKALWSTPDSAIDAAVEWWWRNRCRDKPSDGDNKEELERQQQQAEEERARRDDGDDGGGDDPPSAPRGVACDVGCGDGRVVLRWAEFLTERGREAGEAGAGARRRPPFLPPRLVGIDVDPDRIQEARRELERLRLERRVGETIEVEFWCGNALDLLPSIAHRVEVCFLYLVPRGLRRIKPILLEPCKSSGSSWSPPLRVITYVSPLEGEAPVRVDRVKVPHQPGASWPLYLYEFYPRDAEGTEKPDS
jgi:SAM-dependent methyltransferase